MYDIIIVGAGAAGLTAAIYAARANKKVLVFESKAYGGQIVTSSRIENYPAAPHISGTEFAEKLYEQAKDLGARVEFEEVEKIEKAEDGKFKVTTDEDEYEAGAIIIATGSTDKKLGIPSEDKFVGRGVSYCATCDGAIYKDKDVAVIGGGNTAFYDALYLADIAKKIYLIHRRAEFRADEALVEKVKAKGNVEFVLNAKVKEFSREEKLEKIELDSSLANADASASAGGNSLVVSAAFIAVGRAPAIEKLNGLVKLDENDYIVAGEDCKTSTPGVFVAGDVRTKSLRQLVTAASDGAIAATGAVEYLN